MQCLKKGCDGHYEPICTTCEVPKWIKVTEKLPKKYVHVLTYARKNELLPYLDANFFEATYEDDDRWYECVDSCRIDVIAWMPLPNEPKV